ncbi:hypothetical protein LZ30DRAFT_706711 [Colletotrichum cereale]|nr:hypothetical protein LZ30DRAFT_706711 [Colletotrichum cereale]
MDMYLNNTGTILFYSFGFENQGRRATTAYWLSVDMGHRGDHGKKNSSQRSVDGYDGSKKLMPSPRRTSEGGWNQRSLMPSGAEQRPLSNKRIYVVLSGPDPLVDPRKPHRDEPRWSSVIASAPQDRETERQRQSRDSQCSAESCVAELDATPGSFIVPRDQGLTELGCDPHSHDDGGRQSRLNVVCTYG